MAAPLLQLSDIALTFGGTPLLEGVDLMVAAGERLCLVGRNGAGKSTLLKIAASLIEPDGGKIFRKPDATVRYLPQEPDFSGFATVSDYVEAGFGPNDDHNAARYLLEQLGLRGDENPAALSGGEARRAALVRVLAPAPDILLLDEPTNHLDLPAIEWLEGELAARKVAFVIISHDRRFLSNLSRVTVWLDRGKARRIERGFTEFEAWRDDVLAEEERERRKLDRKIEAEEHWMRYGVTARRKRNMRRVAGLKALRQQRRDARRAAGTVAMAAAEAERSGALVIEATGISKGYGGPPMVAEFSARIQRGDRIGIVGPNGSGKTTLVNLLTGALAPDSGSVRLGANLQMATLDQRRESLNPDWTVSEALTGGRGDAVMVGGRAKHVISYMRDFLFDPEQARTPLRVLSGGERGRLMLARALAKPSNLLVLDEPTNDLDLETLDVLEEMIGDYAGTVLLISHARDFLDRIVDAVIVPEGNGKWLEYAGGYTDMLAQRGDPLPVLPGLRGRAGRGQPAAKPGAPIEARLPRTAARPAKRKLNFNEKHALETLPGRIATLTAEIARLQTVLADTTLYVRDRAAFDRASSALTAIQTELAAAEECWLELELKRDEIENA
ncbi:MAG TPA: ATP-binding cassette domain-containing protein [Xanthobacteraceae bacterium]|nr:ATP-binding cassette domain-containing protein [Xanthobacteraceae bacterium]